METMKCDKCGGEMKEVNGNMMKCEDCGLTVNINEDAETEDSKQI